MREMLSSMAMITATQLKGICFDSSWMTVEMTHRGSYHLSSSKHGKSSMTTETKMKCSLYTPSFSPTSVPTKISILLLSFDLSTKLLHLQYRDSHGIFVPVENEYSFTRLISERSAQSLVNGCLHTLLRQVWCRVVPVRPLVEIEIMFTVSFPLPVLSRYEEAVRGGTGSFGDAGLVGQDPNV